MAIKLDPNLNLLAAQKLPRGSSATLADNLSDSFTKMLSEVNNLQNAADKKIEEFATSKDKDIHGTMIAMQKADISLRLLMQVRSKLTVAYQELMRTQM